MRTLTGTDDGWGEQRMMSLLFTLDIEGGTITSASRGSFVPYERTGSSSSITGRPGTLPVPKCASLEARRLTRTEKWHGDTHTHTHIIKQRQTAAEFLGGFFAGCCRHCHVSRARRRRFTQKILLSRRPIY
mmetsp:Transcript_18404/g.33340  ORF Transcript_18404/g.33340 Transcript_18404/m.33340 type:complete len:131 (+) Transcript_18404:1214-1606(+)